MDYRERLSNEIRRIGTPGEALVTISADCRDEEVTFDQEGNTTEKKFESSKTFV